MIEPTHCTLPLWRDRDDAQRAETLDILKRDLDVYAAAPISVKLDGLDASAARGVLLDHYRRVLAAPIAAVRDMLQTVEAYDEQERQSIASILELLDMHPNLFNAQCEVGHITGSALVVDPQNRRALLHKHKKLGRWLQFGGHMDYETDPLQVALREGFEESGLPDLRPLVPHVFDADLHEIPEHKGRPVHLHADMRYLLATDQPDRLQAGEGESDEFMWVSLDTLPEAPTPEIEYGVLRMLQKARILLNL